MADLDFRGRVAIVTGGAGGLGREYVRSLAEGGAQVVLSDLATDDPGAAPGARLAEQLRGEGRAVTFRAADMAVEAEATELVESTIDGFGRLDILINNAGNGAFGLLQAHTTEMLDAVLREDLYGTFWTMKAALPAMRKQGYGRIVNTGSNLGAFGGSKMSAHCAAKAGVIALTKVAALENVDVDVGVNAIAPTADTRIASGWLERHPMFDRKMFSAKDVAAMVTYLCHQKCRVTGNVFSSMGGRHATIWSATACGYFNPGARATDIEDNLDQILSHDGAVAPRSNLDEFALVIV